VSGTERKGWAPSQIGGQHWANDVECGAICVKRGMPSVERGVIRDRCNRKVRGPATRLQEWKAREQFSWDDDTVEPSARCLGADLGGFR